MLRAPGSRYVPGRSEVLLKVKSFYDAEATVVGHLPGTGKHTGRLGALQVELPDGTRFKVGTGFTDAEREDPPAVGTVVTFRYQELTRAGVPRFPSFLRERPDAEWPAQTAATKQKASKKAPAKRRARAAEAHTAATKQKASKKAPAKRHVAAADPGQGSARRFEFVEGSSRKFWEITVHGDAHTVRYGRIGSDGQTKTKAFGGAAAAQADAEKLIAKKTAKGYVERAGG